MTEQGLPVVEAVNWYGASGLGPDRAFALNLICGAMRGAAAHAIRTRV
jgi:hypothetical protein